MERVLGQLPGFCSAGEVVFIWQRALTENQLCGCGEHFKDCHFWQRVGKAAFDGWDKIDPAEMIALARNVDRNRYIPFLVQPRLRPGARKDLERYAGVMSKLYQAIAEVSGARVVIDASKHASTAFLLRQVPDISPRFVHLVRDSRGVAYSWTKQVKKPEVTDGDDYMPVYRPHTSAARWVSYNLMFDVLGAVDDTLVLRYESILSDPRGRWPGSWPTPASPPPPRPSTSSATAMSTSASTTPWPATRCASTRGASTCAWTTPGARSWPPRTARSSRPSPAPCSSATDTGK